MNETPAPGADLQRVDPPVIAPSRNYLQAVELGHVLAASGYYTDARDPAKAAVKVMIGMDLGLSPTAALQTIHAFEENGRMVFLIEGKALAALIKARPGYDYRILERTEEACELEFVREGEALTPTIKWTMADATRAGLTSKSNWQKYPREMLTWRVIAEGVRLHFPELLSGSPVYTDAEFGVDSSELRLREALEGPPKAQPLTDEEAELQRAAIREAFDELHALNPERMARPLLERRIREAEHSHENLANVLASMNDLVVSEARVQELATAIRERMPKDAATRVLEAGERQQTNGERIDLYENTLGDLEGREADADADELGEAAQGQEESEER